MGMGRRGENIRKRKDGRWEARIICSYDREGRAKYCSLYGKSYLEVKEKKKQFLMSLPQNGKSNRGCAKNYQKIRVSQVAEE